MTWGMKHWVCFDCGVILRFTDIQYFLNTLFGWKGKRPECKEPMEVSEL